MPQGFFSNSFFLSRKLPLSCLWNPDPRDRDLGTNFLDLSTKVPASCLENPTFRGPRVLGAKRFSLRTKVPFGCLEKPAEGADPSPLPILTSATGASSSAGGGGPVATDMACLLGFRALSLTSSSSICMQRAREGEEHSVSTWRKSFF